MGRDQHGPATAVDSPFGEVLWRLVRHTPGALGAVLVDDMGDPIDYAHWPERIAVLDVQIIGAQITQAVERLDGTMLGLGLENSQVMLTAANGTLMTGSVGGGYYVSLAVRGDQPVAFAFRQFGLAIEDLAELLA